MKLSFVGSGGALRLRMASRLVVLLACGPIFGSAPLRAKPPQAVTVPPPQVIPPTDTRTGPARKLSEIHLKNDLLKMSGEWWGKRFDEFPESVGLKPGDYSASDDPTATVDPTAKGNKVIFLHQGISADKWTPKELAVFAFTFKASDGLRLAEIKGFLGNRSEADMAKVLTRRYGEPTQILRALNFTTYVWDFDESVLNLNFMSFMIVPKVPGKDGLSGQH
jgi:hypothetical protein